MPKYFSAPEVKEIADALIMAHHDHLSNEPFRFIFKDKASKKGDKIVRGTASVLSGRAAFLAFDLDDWNRECERQENPSFFLIEIAKDTWDEMDENQQQALVDHELSHCHACDVEKGKGEEKRTVRTLSTVGHDIEEFAHIVQRYGFWKDELKNFAKVCSEKATQLGLFEIQERTSEQHVEVRETVGAGRKKK